MGVVVSVLSDPLALIPHQKLVEIMELSNNLICLSKVTYYASQDNRKEHKIKILMCIDGWRLGGSITSVP